MPLCIRAKLRAALRGMWQKHSHPMLDLDDVAELASEQVSLLLVLHTGSCVMLTVLVAKRHDGGRRPCWPRCLGIQLNVLQCQRRWG